MIQWSILWWISQGVANVKLNMSNLTSCWIHYQFMVNCIVENSMVNFTLVANFTCNFKADFIGNFISVLHVNAKSENNGRGGIDDYTKDGGKELFPILVKPWATGHKKIGLGLSYSRTDYWDQRYEFSLQSICIDVQGPRYRGVQGGHCPLKNFQWLLQ